MRPIDADALVEAIKDYPYGFRGMIVCDIAKQPTIEPKHGRWIAVEYNDGSVHTECSVCGYGRGLPPVRNYCPNCGAQMERSEDEEQLQGL